MCDDCNATRWACDMAAAQKSHAKCDKCTWWQPPELVRSSEQLARADGSVEPTTKRPSTAWFMCVNRPQETLRARHSKFIQLVQVAVASAKLHAPSLAPFVLYMHSSEQSFDDSDELSRWLTGQGVRVVNSRLSFSEAIPRIRWRMKTLTGICKMDIPRSAHAMQAELAGRGLDPHRILWTDADVIFSGDWHYPRDAPLPTFAAGTEVFSSSLNSGVIYGNVSVSHRDTSTPCSNQSLFPTVTPKGSN